MSNIAPSPSSSSSGEDNGSDNSNSKGAPPPPGSSSSSSSSSSSRSPSNSKGEFSQSPPPPSSGGSSRSSSPSDSQDSSSSSPPSPSGGSPPSRSSPSPSSQPSPNPSPSSRNGGNANSSPPPSPPSNSSPNKGSSNSSQNSGNSNSSPSPGKSSSPPQRSGGSSPSPPSPPSPSSSQSPRTESGESSSSPKAWPPRSSPAPPQKSNNGESSSEPSPRTPSSSPSPPPPTNQSVVFVPVPVLSNGPPDAPPPPGSVAISPGSSVTSTNLPSSTPSSQVANAGSQQVPGSSGTSNSGDGSSPNSDALSQSSLASSRVGTSHVAAAIAGAAITGLMFVVVAVFLVVSRRKKKRSPDRIVYHNDGSYYVHSGQLGGANQSGRMLYHPRPPGASAGFSYGSPASGVDNAGGGGYYQSGIMESKSSFSYEELTSITSNFSRDNVIGEGGFGCVYKGWLADGKCVAVKQLKAGSGQGEREFQAEVEIISRVHHRHLVSLVGYCVAAHHRMLIFEFVPNGTLEHHLHGRGVPVMDWPTRLRIAIGAAKGLAYLHEDCHPRIIHRDIKSANILLDYSFEAQVADFGLAKLSNDTHTHVSTRIMGTFGYLAPEYASSGKLTDRSDVFSFGVVLLELITGRKPVDQTRPLGEESLVEWARPVLADAVETGDLDALVDPQLEGAYNRGEMVVMVEAAAACVRHSAPKRPRMVQVMRALDDDAGGMSDLSNGVKVGQSRAYGSRNHVAAIQQLRLTAFASEEFTGEFEQSSEYGGGTDSETQPMNRRFG